MSTLFISDLHLQPQRPHITRAFFNLLQGRARQADALYILGDFFDVWIGDDEQTPLQQEVAAALKSLADSGTAIKFLPGNRDFLIGEAYCQQAGMELIPDPSTITLYGTPILLMHGDSLCTDDRSYQRYRRVIRSGFIRWLQHYVPLARRQQIGRLIRGKSAEHNQYKSRQLMDINPSAAISALRDARAATLIHGHTHRPDTHRLVVDGRECERLVLGDWDRFGWLLEWHPDGRHQLERFEIPAGD